MAANQTLPLTPHFDDSAPKVPIQGKKNVLITSALPYVNNVPHLGNIIGCVLSADVFARYSRQKGENTLFVCGTDEYGTATETKALQENTTPQAICDKYHAIHADVYRQFHIRFDIFGRTSTSNQKEIAQSIFHQLDKNEFVQQNDVEQLFCTECSRYLADRYIEGICPLCQYSSARGDQCDDCGKLLNPTQLVQPRCTVCRKVDPISKRETHIFLDLEKLQPHLEDWLRGGTVTLDRNAEGITTTWLTQGLRPRCITRDLKWGTPVPKPGFEEKVFYVWYDAPIGYLSITKTYTEDWEKWWKNPDEVDLFMFMGKDNVPFHTVLFPCTLLGTDEKWTTLNYISTTEYLMFEGQAFSKSRGIGVFGNQVLDTGISIDTWRYVLLSNRPETSDSNFAWEELMARNNNELLANVGNFVNRSLKFLWSKYEKEGESGKISGVLPSHSNLLEDDLAIFKEINTLLAEYRNAMDQLKIREGLQKVLALGHRSNKYLQDNKPWVLFKSEPERCKTVVVVSLHFLYILATILAPFLPHLASQILYDMGLISQEDKDHLESHPYLPEPLSAEKFPLPFLQPGHRIREPKPLIQEIKFIEWNKKVYGEDPAAAKPEAKGNKGNKAWKGSKPTPQKKEKGKEKEKEPKEEMSEERAALIEKIRSQRLLIKQLEKEDKKEELKEAQETLKGLSLQLKKPTDHKKAAAKGKKGGANGKKDDGFGLDLRIGNIVSVENHGSADTLYVLKVDVGEDSPRQICSGLRSKYTSEELQGKLVVVVCNLKVAKLRGVESKGMILAGVAEDVTGILVPQENVVVGSRVAVENHPIPESFSTLSKSSFEKYSLVSDGQGLATFDSSRLVVVPETVPILTDPTRNLPSGTKIK